MQLRRCRRRLVAAARSRGRSINSQSDGKYPTLTDYPSYGPVLSLVRRKCIHCGNHLTGVFYAICPSILSMNILRLGCLAPLPSSPFSQAKEGRQPTVLIHS
jgi:hypothetical protein